MTRSAASFLCLPQFVQVAALATVLSASQKALLGWIARHPLLPAGHLAMHAGLPPHAAPVLLADLLRLGLIDVDIALAARLGAPSTPRYVLTMRGAAMLAARDGVPLRRYLVDGVIATSGEEVAQDGRPAAPHAAAVRLVDLRRHPEHTAGVQDFALALAREAAAARARGVDHRLLDWANPAEAQVTVRERERTWTVRPDAQFRYRIGGEVYNLLLEWDRGLVRRRDYARKFAAYAAYALTHRGCAASTRLIVATTQSAVERVQGELLRAERRASGLSEMSVIVSHEDVRCGRIMALLRASCATE